MEEVTRLLLTTENSTLQRATVVALLPGGVVVTGREGEARSCDVLDAPANVTALREGDPVFVWLPENTRERGIVIGRVRGDGVPVTEQPDELIIEAGKQLTLRVGAGSITIREDGKILIKGKDLVSHATRLNRIKGGAVQIN